MEQRPTTAEIAMADYYQQYCGGFAYIPFQDLIRYEKAFKKVIAYNKCNK